MKNDVIAVEVGYNFGFIPAKELEGVKIKPAGAVRYEGENRDLFKAATYDDSRKLDALLDKYGEMPVKDYRIEPVIMSGELEMKIPGFNKERDSFLFGGYSFVCNGKDIPVEFNGIAWDIQQNGDQILVPFTTGKTPLATDYFLDDCYEEDYLNAGLRINDITAAFLAKASSISEFMVSLEMNGKEYAPDDIGMAIRSLRFGNATDVYPVKQDVMESFNSKMSKGRKHPLTEQIRAAADQSSKSHAASDSKAKDREPEI